MSSTGRSLISSNTFFEVVGDNSVLESAILTNYFYLFNRLANFFFAAFNAIMKERRIVIVNRHSPRRSNVDKRVKLDRAEHF